MAVKLVALYKRPMDIEAFLRHYTEIHLPLVRKTPYLECVTVSKVTGSPTGEPPFFMMAELIFPTVDLFREAMRSPENKAAGKDLIGFAGDLVTVLVTEEQQL